MQVTIFTCALWTKEVAGRQVAIVSDDLNHDKHSVMVYLEKLFHLIKTDYPNITSVRIFSDGCAAQFKNKWMVSTVTRVTLCLTVTSWSFFATAHGKGLVDVIGGRAKSTVWMKVRARRAVVKNANDFFNVASRFIPGITFFYVPECVIREEATINTVRDAWADTLSVVGIREHHHFERGSEDSLVAMALTSVTSKRAEIRIRR